MKTLTFEPLQYSRLGETRHLVRIGNSPITPKSHWRKVEATSTEHAMVLALHHSRKGAFPRFASKTKQTKAYVASAKPGLLHSTGVPKIVTCLDIVLGPEG